jgi:hypothetical protein
MKKIFFTITIVFFSSILDLQSQAIDKSKKELNSDTRSGNSTTINNSGNSSTVSGIGADVAFFFVKVFGFLSYEALIGNYKTENHLRNSLNIGVMDKINGFF